MRSIAMDEDRMNHYEKQLYTVFKTFDVNNEEALDRAAVLQLCDALQLEARGAALVDSLFERRAERVTFATFRNGLLSVLGAAPAEPAAPAETEPAAAGAPAHSDDDSSGREVAPKFVVGVKKYGRRSRPARGGDEPSEPRAASASRVDVASPRRARYRRSASAMEGRAGDARLDHDSRLDHDRRVDAAQAAALCRELQMDGIDPRLVERMFDDAPGAQITVGEFFDRLNAALTSLAAAGAASPDEDEEALPGAAVAEAWERAGVRRPRRLLAELGLDAAALRPRDLERALDEELRALGPAPDERLDARPLLQLAALAVARLRLGRARARAAAAVAERDKLRADLAEANRRARLLAQDVDENLARAEAERAAALRQAEARHAEAARAAADEAAAERERAAAARADLAAETARRADLEARLRAELAALAARADRSERRAGAAEHRAEAAEKDRARAEEEALAAAAAAACAAECAAAAERELAAARARHAAEAARLRDRADELAAALEARAPAPPTPARDTSWREEAGLDADAPLAPDRIEECEGPPARRDVAAQADAARLTDAAAQSDTARVIDAAAQSDARLTDAAAQTDARTSDVATQNQAGRSDVAILSGPAAPADAAIVTDAAAQTDAAPADDLAAKHEAEKNSLNEIIAGLEAGLEALRVEYEQCEEYWAGKLAEERAGAEAEAAAADARLAELLRRVAHCERTLTLPALPESALEPQYAELQQEFDAYKAESASELAAARERAAALERELAAARAAPAQPCACQQSVATGQRAASDGAPRRARPGAERSPAASSAGGGRAGGAVLTEEQCTCVYAAQCMGWRAAAGGLRARAAHAERAAARLLARLRAADALVADLYRENCQLQRPIAL